MTGKKIVDSETLPYRPCVGIAVFNRAGKVWAGRRCRREHDEMTGAMKLWQLPQGGVDEGEKPLEAACRELWEETGIRSVELIAEMDSWIDYDLPRELVGVALCGKYRGQRQKWFAMRFIGKDSEIRIDLPPGGHRVEFDDWAWVALEEIPQMVVPFKRAVYENVAARFHAVIHP